MRVNPLLQLTSEERKTLRAWRFGQKVEYRLKVRALIVWGLFHYRQTVDEVAAWVGVTARTVRKWRSRFCTEGINGLYDRPRSGAPLRFRVEQRCEVVALACDDPARYGFAGQTGWTLDTLTDAVHRTVEGWQISRSSVWRTLTQNDLKPHRVRMWLHSPDPALKEKVNAVVELYLHPPEEAVVLCVDEKTSESGLGYHRW